jgi:hypothetical protein
LVSVLLVLVVFVFAEVDVVREAHGFDVAGDLQDALLFDLVKSDPVAAVSELCFVEEMDLKLGPANFLVQLNTLVPEQCRVLIIPLDVFRCQTDDLYL